MTSRPFYLPESLSATATIPGVWFVRAVHVRLRGGSKAEYGLGVVRWVEPDAARIRSGKQATGVTIRVHPGESTEPLPTLLEMRTTLTGVEHVTFYRDGPGGEERMDLGADDFDRVRVLLQATSASLLAAPGDSTMRYVHIYPRGA